MLQFAIKFVNRHPALRRMALVVFDLVPALQSRIVSGALGNEPAPTFAAEFDDLTPQGKQIYRELVSAIEQHQNRKVQG